MLYYLHSTGEYTDFQGDIVGNPERAIRFTLTYVTAEDRFYGVVDDTDNTGFNNELENIPHDIAKFMIGEEEYSSLKASPAESDSHAEVKQALGKVLKLAKGGQQSWWAEDLRKDSEEAIEKVEKYYTENYG